MLCEPLEPMAQADAYHDIHAQSHTMTYMHNHIRFRFLCLRLWVSRGTAADASECTHIRNTAAG
jgi:hypothetical protein